MEFIDKKDIKIKEEDKSYYERGIKYYLESDVMTEEQAIELRDSLKNNYDLWLEIKEV